MLLLLLSVDQTLNFTLTRHFLFQNFASLECLLELLIYFLLSLLVLKLPDGIYLGELFWDTVNAGDVL